MKKSLPDTTTKELEKPKTQQNEYLQIKIPRLSFKSVNLYLVIALVIFAFFLGILTHRVFYLQDTLKTQNSNNTQTGQLNNIAANDTAPLIPTLQPKVDVAIGHLPTLGNDNAKVTVVEFSDFQCPFCKQYIDNTYPQLFDTYIKTDKIKFAYRHYPLISIHPNAQKAAEASECANEQDKFWDYHDLLFKNQDTWSPLAAADAAITFTDYAGELGLNTEQFRSCLDSAKYKQKVDDDIAEANKVGVDGTPAFFVNGWRLTGAQPFPQFQTLIEQELKK